MKKPTEKVVTHRKNNPVVKAIEDMKSETRKGHESIDTYLNKPVHELTPELVEKIAKDMLRRQYRDKVSKEQVLHHLKQLKAEIGRYWKKTNWSTPEGNEVQIQTLRAVNAIIDKKIAKINSK